MPPGPPLDCMTTLIGAYFALRVPQTWENHYDQVVGFRSRSNRMIPGRFMKKVPFLLIVFYLSFLVFVGCPNAINTKGEIVDAPSIDPEAEVITDSDMIELRCATYDAKIVYTTDGTDPVVSNTTIAKGTLFTAPFSLALGRHSVKAIAYKSGMRNSDIYRKDFVVHTIYTTGMVCVSTGADSVMWRNKTMTVLPSPSPVNGPRGTAIEISNSDIYIAGICFKGSASAIPCYWKNGNRTEMPGTDAYTTSIAINSGDILISGGNNGVLPSACYWKNGSQYALNANLNGTYSSQARSIFATNGKIYIAGLIQPKSNKGNIACYWVDGQRVDLTSNASSSNANSIYVSGDKVYLAGEYYNGSQSNTCYWVDGVRFDLKDDNGGAFGSMVTTSIVVSNGKVYVAGFGVSGLREKAFLWINGAATCLDEGVSSRALGIKVLDNAVFVSGYCNEKACYWINGVRTDLPEIVGEIQSEANAIFVL